MLNPIHIALLPDKIPDKSGLRQAESRSRLVGILPDCIGTGGTEQAGFKATGAQGLDVSPFHRHIAPLERKENMMKLTPQQVEQFQENGYLKISHRLIADDHLDLLREHYDALFAKKRGTSGEGLRNLAVVGETEQDETADRSEEMLQIMEMWRYDEVYHQLLYHEPLLDIAESLIGPNIQLFHDQALYKPARHGGEVPWHQDNGYWRCTPANLVSIWMALDDADEENGCMNVIPGSHLESAPDHDRAVSEKGKLPALLQADVDENRAAPVPLKAGCGMVHHCMMLHQTNPNRSQRRRRAMVIHYMPTGTLNGKGEPMTDRLLLRGEL